MHIATKAQAQKQRTNESYTSCVESKKEKLAFVSCQKCNDKQTSDFWVWVALTFWPLLVAVVVAFLFKSF
jgi:hypothetical protein